MLWYVIVYYYTPCDADSVAEPRSSSRTVFLGGGNQILRVQNPKFNFAGFYRYLYNVYIFILVVLDAKIAGFSLWRDHDLQLIWYLSIYFSVNSTQKAERLTLTVRKVQWPWGSKHNYVSQNTEWYKIETGNDIELLPGTWVLSNHKQEVLSHLFPNLKCSHIAELLRPADGPHSTTSGLQLSVCHTRVS